MSEKNYLHRILQPLAKWIFRRSGLESLETYRSLVEHSLVGVYLIQDGRFTYCNPRMAQIFGYDSNRDIIEHKTVADLVWPQDRDLVLDNIRRRIEAEVDTVQYTFRGLCRDGSTVDVEVMGTGVEHQGGPAVIGTLRDVTAERANQRELKLMANALANAAEVMGVLDGERRILSANKALTSVFGYKESEVVGKKPDLLRSGRHHQTFYDHLWGEVDRNGFWKGEMTFRRKNGEIFSALNSISKLSEDGDGANYYVVVISDISDYRQVQEKLNFLSHYDPLTELPNRALLSERLGQAIERAARGKRQVTVMMLDLDDFKRVNESLGHGVGDELLRAVAYRLRDHARGETLLAHTGADEFALVLEGRHSADEINATAAGIQMLFAEPFDVGEQTIQTGVSIGICTYPFDEDDVDGLLKQADAALHQAKQRGRGLYQFAASRHNAGALDTIKLAAGMHQALENREFEIYFQPLVELTNRQIFGVEALLRWHHPELGFILPDRFIPVAEQTGQIGVIGQWVLEDACRQLATWREQPGLESIQLAVNVSLRQLHTGNFPDQVERVLHDTGMEPEALHLEITETVVMSDPEHMQRVLKQIADMGVRIAVDDFGIGHSSLGQLKAMPVNELKIDRSFVNGLPDDDNDVAITRAIIAMASSLGLRQVAEGIETDAQREWLLAAGCKYGQGLLFSAPLRAQDLILVLEHGEV